MRRRSEADDPYLLYFMVSILLFVTGVPLFFLFKTSSFLFQVGGVVLLASMIGLICGLGNIVK
jgi:hypothetical protein